MSCCAPGQSQNSIAECGKFDTPTNPDLGQCSPKSTKTDCEAPTLPTAPCPGEVYTTVYNPDATPPFSVIAGLFDQNCLPILDSNNVQIMVTIQ